MGSGLEKMIGFEEDLVDEIYGFILDHLYILLGFVILVFLAYLIKRIRKAVLTKILERECLKRNGTLTSKKGLFMTYRYGKNMVRVGFLKRGKHQPKRTEVFSELRLRKNLIFIIKKKGYKTTIDYRKLRPFGWEGMNEFFEIRGNDDYFMLKLLDDDLKNKILALKGKLMEISLTGSVYDKHELRIILKGMVKDESEFENMLKLAEFLIYKIREPGLIPIS